MRLQSTVNGLDFELPAPITRTDARLLNELAQKLLSDAGSGDNRLFKVVGEDAQNRRPVGRPPKVD